LARNRHVARRLHDQGWAEFQAQLAYKTTWYGSQLLLAPRAESVRTVALSEPSCVCPSGSTPAYHAEFMSTVT
jgi:hypothetical protein